MCNPWKVAFSLSRMKRHYEKVKKKSSRDKCFSSRWPYFTQTQTPKTEAKKRKRLTFFSIPKSLSLIAVTFITDRGPVLRKKVTPRKLIFKKEESLWPISVSRRSFQFPFLNFCLDFLVTSCVREWVSVRVYLYVCVLVCASAPFPSL